jgi:D-beta-D-heptose 7-phosphate kinase / D-beta-D-heptose 1-phosphate adenosyltransferase
MSGRLVVVGDALLDRDVDGAVGRVAPDAPVPVLDESSAVDRPGGAGLAALLAARTGADVALVTALGDDTAGARVAALLAAAGVAVYPLPLHGSTPEKIRLRARGQTLLRLDRGGNGSTTGEAPAAVTDLLREAGAILVSDYGRGVARSPSLRAAVAAARAPVVWDPHPRGPAAVPGARLVTPNEAEARALTGAAPGVTVAGCAATLRDRWRAHAVAGTTGATGAVLCHAGPTPLVIPAAPAGGADPCGAGDRFASAAALALGAGALVSEAVREAVAAASAYVEAGGPASLAAPSSSIGTPVTVGPSASEVVARVRAAGGTVVATGGCFDLLHAGHVATLEAARGLGDCLVVCLNSDASVAGLKGPGRPVVGQADRARVLSALSCVDAVVVFDEPTPHAVLSWLRPDVWVKGGDYDELPEAEVVRRWGGETVVVPYLDGRSTSSMIAVAKEGAR